jgi:hypothetical protein
MKVFIWYDIDELTDNYHSDGGLVVIADNLEDARILAMERNVKFKDIELQPDLVYELKDYPKDNVIIFPNAGCC